MVSGSPIFRGVAAGKFNLDALKDDNSLILTAASRDRSSFGWGVESEFTYFGKAFFVEAWKDTRSFIEAFGSARTRRGLSRGGYLAVRIGHFHPIAAGFLGAIERLVGCFDQLPGIYLRGGIQRGNA